MYEDFFNNGLTDRYGPVVDRDDCATIDEMVEKYAEEMWQPEDSHIDKDELRATLVRIMEEREERKPRYITSKGERYRYLLADVAGTQFGVGDTEEAAIQNAIDAEASYLDENDEWKTVTRDWIDTVLNSGPEGLYIEDAEQAFFGDEDPHDIELSI